MKLRYMIWVFAAFWAGISGLVAPVFGQAIVIDHSCTDLSQIPEYWLEQAKGLTLHYAHTSHGGQITSGIQNLEDLDTYYSMAIRNSSSEGLPPVETPPALRIYDGNPPETYISPNDYWEGSSAWARTTAVAATGNYDFSMWSWCGQVSSASESYINEYLETMDRFETWYPGMRFIYMTGHLDGSGSSGTLHQRNEQIRDYCTYYYKVLFDFADIERYDPDGVDYLDLGANDDCDYSGGNWANEWCAANPGSELCEYCSCAHSRSLNCNQKARAFWWMMARLAGWNGQTGAPTPTPAPSPTPEVTPICSPCMVEAWGSVYDGVTLAPIENAYVELTGSDWKYDWFGNDWTDQSGIYNIQGGACCGGGEGAIQASAWGYQTAIQEITFCCSNSVDFYLDPLATPTPTPWSPYTPTCTPTPSPAPTVSIEVLGTVLDAWTNHAVEGARVYLRTEYRYHHTTTNATGNFWFITGGPTRATLSASAPGYYVSTVKTFLGFPANDITLYLTPSAGQTGGDYDGDGTADIAVFRKGSGLWAVRAVTRLYFGTYSDLPVAGDYDGDGTTEPSIFRDSGLWAIRGLTRLYFGASGGLPVPSDYNGDGTTDVAVFREEGGLWAIRAATRLYFGTYSDLPVAGDYDGDGTAEAGIYRPAAGLWAARSVTRAYFGAPGDLPIPADWSGSGFVVPAVFRPDTGLWAAHGISRSYFGVDGDEPVPADFDGDGIPDIAIFRGSSGLWAARGVTRVYYGTTGDIPAAR